MYICSSRTFAWKSSLKIPSWRKRQYLSQLSSHSSDSAFYICIETSYILPSYILRLIYILYKTSVTKRFAIFRDSMLNFSYSYVCTLRIYIYIFTYYLWKKTKPRTIKINLHHCWKPLGQVKMLRKLDEPALSNNLRCRQVLATI